MLFYPGAIFSLVLEVLTCNICKSCMCAYNINCKIDLHNKTFVADKVEYDLEGPPLSPNTDPPKYINTQSTKKYTMRRQVQLQLIE